MDEEQLLEKNEGLPCAEKDPEFEPKDESTPNKKKYEYCQEFENLHKL